MSDRPGKDPEQHDPAALKQRRRRAVKTALIVGAVAFGLYAYSLFKAFSAG